MRRRLAFFVALLGLALAGPVFAAGENCGCGPKAIPEVRAQQYYQMALQSSDPATQRKLAETALRIDPNNAGAKALLETLDDAVSTQ